MKNPTRSNQSRIRIYALLICAVVVPLFFALVGRLTAKADTKTTDAVTYAFSGGRFGDNLLAYLHGKWVSYQYKLPLLYKPFPYSDQLALDDQEDVYESADAKQFKKVSFAKFAPAKKYKKPALYEVPYFPEFAYELAHDKDATGNSFFSFDVDWNDPAFRQEIVTLIQPKRPLSLLQLPAPPTGLTVAMHMRKGGGFDSQDVNLKIPLKAPPNQFYVDAIKKVREAFPAEKLYVYIFTDDHAPSKIVDTFAQIFRGQPITFDCRKSQNSEKDNVLEDFFSMLQFDCLIRPESNYSYVASKLKDYKIVVHPESVKWENGLPIIDKIKVTK